MARWPAPISVETQVLDSGERITTLVFPEPFQGPVSGSADRIFSDARKSPAILVDPLMWEFIKPWLKNEEQQIMDFWHHFNTPEAESARYCAAFGVKYSNWSGERVVVQLVRTIRRLRSAVPAKGLEAKGSWMEMSLMLRLGEWVVGAVENDLQAPRRLHDLLKNPEASDDKTNRDHTPRNVLEAFAKLVADQEQLPTKKAVREAAFLGSDKNDRSVASREMMLLGLKGLQRG